MWSKLSRVILQNRILIILFFIVATVFMAYHAKNLKLSYAGSKILPLTDSVFIKYTNFKQTFGEDGILQLGRVTLREMRALYTQAHAFVFPSLHEGVGLPVLEAMACGCPVVSSRGGSLPEVGGDAAQYIDFSKEMEVEEWLRNVFVSQTPRSLPHAPSIERAASFSWKKSAQIFLDAARELVKAGSHES